MSQELNNQSMDPRSSEPMYEDFVSAWDNYQPSLDTMQQAMVLEKNTKKREGISSIQDGGGGPRAKKSRTHLPNQDLHLNGSFTSLKYDVRDLNSPDIIVPQDLIEDIETVMLRMGNCKIQWGLVVEFIKDDGDKKEWQLSNRAQIMSPTFYEEGILKLQEKLEKYSELSSGWSVNQILEIIMTITKVTEIIHVSGSSYIASPMELQHSKAVVNVKNNDNLCFLYAILAVQKYGDIIKHHDRVTKYTEYISEFKFDGKDMPMKLSGIAKFERANPGLSINILEYTKKSHLRLNEEIYKNPHIDILYRSKVEGQKIYLLLLQKGDNYHYVGVTNLNRLLNYQTTGRTRIQSHWCHTCLHGFRRIKAYEKHIALCSKHMGQTTMYEMPTEKYAKFDDLRKTIKKEFVIYADFESILPEDDKYYQRHEPIAAALLLVQNNKAHTYKQFIGASCVIDFLQAVEEISEGIVYPWYKKNGKEQMKELTDEEENDFHCATVCYLCNKSEGNFVRDHDHTTGLYLGAACNKCNLSRQVRPCLPIVFHNLKGYDLHHILKYAISKFKTWTINVIPQSSEKFLAMFCYVNKMVFNFLDSYAFLISSLANLVKNLSLLPLTSEKFPNSMMRNKGIFPYNVAVSLGELENIKELPTRWEGVTEEEYLNAKEVWLKYNCENLKDYMMIYLQLDVFLLADVFETFRTKSLNDDGLEPLAFLSIPGMAYASALKQLKHKVELVQDPELYHFFKGGIRGGMTFVNKHHVVADENTQLLYIDINNLYGWALSQKLPCGEFHWILAQDELNELMMRCKCPQEFDGEQGYIFEVDLHIPAKLHDFFDDLPVAPVSQCPPGSKVKKLLLTHEDKKNYVVHCRLLQLWLLLGVTVTKCHRGVAFRQANIFTDYIDGNTRKRNASSNPFDRDFYKLKNNSLYGKMIENLFNRMNLRMCNNEKKLVTYTCKAQFRRTTTIADDLIAVHLCKEVVVLDKPSYIGQAVLDLSKVRMYNLQYRDLARYRDEFKCKINIIAGDTDSFFLEVKNCDLQTQLLPKMISDGLLDTSKYNKNHPLYSDSLADKLGLFKDESLGRPYEEWIFLRPKCYSLLMKSDGVEENKATMKAKGIYLKGSNIRHESYRKVYGDNIPISIPQQRIGSINHQLYTLRSTKVALTSTDDKRCWVSKNISHAYGHYSLL